MNTFLQSIQPDELLYNLKTLKVEGDDMLREIRAEDWIRLTSICPDIGTLSISGALEVSSTVMKLSSISYGCDSIFPKLETVNITQSQSFDTFRPIACLIDLRKKLGMPIRQVLLTCPEWSENNRGQGEWSTFKHQYPQSELNSGPSPCTEEWGSIDCRHRVGFICQWPPLGFEE
jgi:hypothetical protein